MMEKFYVLVLKIPFCLVAGLYCLGFGFSGVNMYGQVDFWIPFERVMLFGVGMVFMGVVVMLFVRSLREVGWQRKR